MEAQWEHGHAWDRVVSTKFSFEEEISVVPPYGLFEVDRRTQEMYGIRGKVYHVQDYPQFIKIELHRHLRESTIWCFPFGWVQSIDDVPF